jgi:cytochrome P450
MAAENEWNKKGDAQNAAPATTFLNAILRCLASGTLSEVEVIANAHLVLLAGYETTANSVTFLMHYLAQNMEYQERLRESFQKEDDEFFQMVTG